MHFLFTLRDRGAVGESTGALPIAPLARPHPSESAARGAMIGYRLHVLVLLTFLNYLALLKHIHLLGALPTSSRATAPRARWTSRS
jgi:hypothetical protein